MTACSLCGAQTDGGSWCTDCRRVRAVKWREWWRKRRDRLLALGVRRRLIRCRKCLCEGHNAKGCE